MDKTIPEIAKRKLNSLFEAFSAVADGTYVYLCAMKYDYSRWSANAVEVFGLPSEYLWNAGELWEEYVHPEDRESYRESVQSIFSGDACGHDMQYRARNAKGEYVVCTCKGVVIRDENGEPEYFGGAIRNQGLFGHIDAMTGLRNQYGFFDDLKMAIDRNAPVTICMLGIGKFTEINEMYGYHYGNLVLQKFGRYLLTEIGSKGCVYRLDGTKFAVISSMADAEEIKRMYAALQQHFQQGVVIDEKFLVLRLNAGLLRLEEFKISDQTVYACLNFAYGESKIRRQGEIVEFYNNLTEENRDRLEKIQVIRNSIARDFAGFYLLYQPVVDAHSEKLVGAEALLRWRDDRYGMVPPDHFIPILERDPMFISLGRWILKTAMTDGKKVLERCPDFVISVNLSYAQLERADFVEMVLGLVKETGFPATNLCLEITERCRLLDMRLLRNVIVNLRAVGVRFALDDFGTGFSSIGIARNLTFDTIKIDRSFVINIEQDGKDQELIAHFTAFASTFGAGVCVEGIETTGMRDILQQYTVASFQGYFYSKPVPMEEFMQSRFVS